VRRSSFLVILAFLLSPAAARAQAGDEFGPARFAFLKPHKTLLKEAHKLLGEPYLDYETSVFADEIDPLVSDDDPTHTAAQVEYSHKTGRKLIDVYVLEYRSEAVPGQYARLVFDAGVLWYALVPLTVSEDNPAKLVDRYGRKPEVRDIKIDDGDVRYTAHLFQYPDLGVAYLQKVGKAFEAKVVFPPTHP